MAFPLVAAVCTPSNVVISGVDFADSQGDKAVVDLLIGMGADIEKNVAEHKIIIRGGRPLHGIEIDMNLIPDSLPALAVAAACAGKNTLYNLAHVVSKKRIACRQQEVLTAAAERWNSAGCHDRLRRAGLNRNVWTVQDPAWRWQCCMCRFAMAK